MKKIHVGDYILTEFSAESHTISRRGVVLPMPWPPVNRDGHAISPLDAVAFWNYLSFSGNQDRKTEMLDNEWNKAVEMYRSSVDDVSLLDLLDGLPVAMGKSDIPEPTKVSASSEDLKLWEILVPTISNEGKPFRTRYHRVWDRHVREITGGLTICPVVKGQWLSDAGELYCERNIPVRIVATREQMVEIVAHTKKYYNQLAVLAYLVSDDVIYDGE